MKTTVSVPGMHCESCVSLIKDVSSDFPSIQQIHIDLNSKRIELEHTEDFSLDAWTREVESLGEKYKVHVLA